MGKRTKVIATLGPAVDDETTLEALIRAGVDVFRLNFSHGSHEEHKERMDRVKKVRERLDSPTAIMLDTKGPEIRTGLLEDGAPVALETGDSFILTPADVLGNAGVVSQSFPQLARYVEIGSTILLDDGLIGLKVVGLDEDEVVCEVLNSGLLGERKSINVPGTRIPLPALTEKDEADLLFGIEQDVDFVAASFVRDGRSVREIRAFLQDHSAHHIGIVAKIENADAVENIADIIAAADGIMVARGDLGVELPPHEVPYLQKRIINACNCAHRPVITATQMLDSMTTNPRPTRAEAADVANAIYDGTDCVMLSGETAVGAYPVETVRTMVQIIETSEHHYFEGGIAPACAGRTLKSVSHAVGSAAVQTAEDINAKCLVCPTMTGKTARLMSSLRAPIPIYSVAPTERVRRSMQLYWGVLPLLGEVCGDMRSVIENARDVVERHGYLTLGDIAVFTCGDRFTSPITRTPDGQIEKFAPANVMYVVQIRAEDVQTAIADGTDSALMTPAFFDKDQR